MPRPATVLVTGFTKSSELAELSLAPLRGLKREGVVDRILAVTWDSPGLRPYVSTIAAMNEVELLCIPEPPGIETTARDPGRAA